MSGKGSEFKQLARNKKAFHDFFIEETFEAGIELTGAEVKSIRLGRINLKDSFCTVKNGELFVRGMHISPYEKGSYFNSDPLRPRKLLMHKREIIHLYNAVQRDGAAIVPLSVYLKGPRVKIEVSLAKGKKLHDKRDSEAKKDALREISRSIKDKNNN